MSTAIIKLENGVKIMVPVSSADEYRRLRGTAAQKEHLMNARAKVQEEIQRRGETVMVDAKTLLAQFNYSCCPRC